jgi:hypothetical protein
MLRALLIWLLVLALPAQGALAASMAFCGPKHHASAGASQPTPQAAHEHHLHAPHDAGGAAEATASPVPPLDSATAGHGDMQSCSVCASCCSGAAIQGTVPKLPSVEPAATVFVTVVFVIEAFTADGPDRPPRHRLA